MTSPNAPDPETLAKIAAQLDPKLVRDDPAKAIKLAHDLLIAADPELAKEAAEQREEMQLQKEGERQDKLFPFGGERISVAEAFKRLPGRYKTERAFTNALIKENLTIIDQDIDLPKWLKARPNERDKFVQHREVTALPAVRELFRRQRKAKQEHDRRRKAASKKKSQKNVVEFQGQKAEQTRRKAERIRQKAEATKQKAEAEEST